MATTVDNPFDTQQPKATNTGIVGSAMTQQQGDSSSAMKQMPTTAGELPGNVGTTVPITPNVATYSPTTRQVDQNTGTVQGQVNSILSKDSPLMARARTLATQQMAQRGLVNSSMAAGAGVAAMVDKATPIASQDAATYNQVAAENTNALNTSGQFNAGEINKFGQQTSQQNFQGQQSQLDRDQQSKLQVGQQEFQAGQSRIQNDFSAEMQKLQESGQDFRQARDISSREAMTNLQNDFNLQMQKLQESGMDFRQARDIASREATVQLEQMGITNRFDKELALKSSQFNVEQNNLERRQILANQMELDKLGLQIKANNAQIPTTFAANVSNTVMQGVSAVYAQPMSADGKPTATERAAQVQSLVNYANGQIAWAEKFYGAAIPRISP
jgi:hypothetical protein